MIGVNIESLLCKAGFLWITAGGGFARGYARGTIFWGLGFSGWSLLWSSLSGSDSDVSKGLGWLVFGSGWGAPALRYGLWPTQGGLQGVSLDYVSDPP